MRAALVAAAVVVTLGAATLSLQAAALQRTPPANQMAARAARWLLGYRLTLSSLRIGGRTIDGRCYHGWYEGLHERLDRGSVLELSDGGLVSYIEPNQFQMLRSFTKTPLNALELAGCTNVLGPRVASLAQFDASVRLRHEWLDGRRVNALHFHHLTLLVARRTDRPVGVIMRGVKSRIRLVPLTPALAHAVETNA
ncbi:MAG TPA: hypothetical protein VF091_09450 [Gaiellaceae bacterium]